MSMKSKKSWVGIDGNEANVSQRVGSNVYAFELLWALYEQMGGDAPYSVRIYLSSSVQPDMPPETDFWQYRVITPAKLWTQWRLPLDLFFGPPVDLFFSPGHYTPRFSPVPVVVSIMDLAFLLYPEQFKKKDLWQLTKLTRHSVGQAAHVVAISEHTKSDVEKFYGYDSKKITVIYPASQMVKIMKNEEVLGQLQKLGVKKPYFVYVGTLQPRKNIVRLVEAFEQCAKSHPQIQLVLAGKVGWLGEPILEKIKTSPLSGRITLLGFVSEEEKQALIQGAEASVLVGLYEGFGIPPLESIQLGTPPVVSNVSSLPEVVGSAGVFVDPFDVGSIADGLNEVLSWSKSERAKRLEAMQKHVLKFQWNISGKKLFKLLESLL